MRYFVEKICTNCGKTFSKYYPPSTQIYKKYFCSWKCKSEYNRVYRVCEECGNTFHKAKSYIERDPRNGLYCSKQCSLKAWSKNYSGENSHGWIKDRPHFICKECGKEFTLPPFEATQPGAGNYCSRKCKNIGHSKNMANENNPNWKGGLDKLPYASDWGPVLRRQIKERDHHQCQECHGGIFLVVHHIDYNKLNCSPNNLITLCKFCHSKTNFHRAYWQRRYNKMLREQVVHHQATLFDIGN